MGSSSSVYQAQIESIQKQLNVIARQIDQLARNQLSSSNRMNQFIKRGFHQNVVGADDIEVQEGFRTEKCTPMVLLLPSEKLGLEDINPVENTQKQMLNQMSSVRLDRVLNIENELPNIFG